MSIGDALAEGRRHVGLTITQVSQRTCIRETIIRAIERGDFSGCGGDFYARGHIRSIAAAVGVDPLPLIDEYDATMGAPTVITAAEVFQPVVPVKLKERRKPNWTATLAVAMVFGVGVFGYELFAGRSQAAPARQTTEHVARTSARPLARTRAAVAHPAGSRSRRLDIRLTATQNCWVQLTSAT